MNPFKKNTPYSFGFAVLGLITLVGCASVKTYQVTELHRSEIGYCGCIELSPDLLQHQVFETRNWVVVLNSNDQHYLGRSIIILKRHAPTLESVSDAEWLDYKQLVGIFAKAASEAFGAEHFNWTFNMNHAFRENPPRPHVHGHVRPRYRNEVKFAGLTFEDRKFGSHYDTTKRPVEPQVFDAIRDKLSRALREASPHLRF